MEQDYVISLKGIRKSFGGVTVLNNVDFNLRRGTVHALVGQNGAGKSTLMKILTGVYTCDEGTIAINGKKIIMNSYSDAIANGISLIFQELSLIPTLTVAENIFLNREIKKGKILDKKQMIEEARKHLQDLNIDVDVNKCISDIDVGLCQMIEITKALSVKSNVLIMDEPTASLSEKETASLFKLIGELKRKGVSIVYISHRMNEIFTVCDEITVLRDGSIINTAKTSEFTMKSLIEQMIGKKQSCADEETKRIRPDNAKKLLEVKNLSWGNKIKDVSFDLYEGEILGLAGLMGSGRTEIVETLFGLNTHASGNILIKGRPYNLKSCKEAIGKGFALVPEDRRKQGLVLMHSVENNLILPGLKRLIKGCILRSKLINKLVYDSIKDLNIKTKNAKTTIRNLSGGNQQKVVISKWLNNSPDIMLMDEPTAGVDIVSKGEIVEILRNFVSNDKGAIFISSDICEMIATCDRFLVLHHGRITAEFASTEIDSEGVLQYAIQHE